MANTYYYGRSGNGRINLTTITASTYSATSDDEVIICDCTSNAITITLPTAITNIPTQSTLTLPTNKKYIIKKKDSTANAVQISLGNSVTPDGYTNWALPIQNDWVELSCDGTTYYFTGGNAAPRIIRGFGQVGVLLTATGATTLFTVPTGRQYNATNVIIYGVTAMSGGTSSTLKVGTSTASYVELLNNSTGIVFTAATATSLLATGSYIDTNSFKVPANASVANVSVFAAGTVIGASVSGTVLTAGKVNVELLGYLT